MDFRTPPFPIARVSVFGCNDVDLQRLDLQGLTMAEILDFVIVGKLCSSMQVTWMCVGGVQIWLYGVGRGMSGIRAKSLAALGRALVELRSSSQCLRRIHDAPAREELFRHVPSRSVGSFLEERFSRHYGTMQFKDSGKSIERQWATCKSLPQVCVRAPLSVSYQSSDVR